MPPPRDWLAVEFLAAQARTTHPRWPGRGRAAVRLPAPARTTTVSARRSSSRLTGAPLSFVAALLLALMLQASLASPAAAQAATPSPGSSPTATPLPAFAPIAQVGGVTRVIAPRGDLAWIGFGPRLAVLDIADLSAPRLIGRSAVLDGVVEDLAVDGVKAVVVTGGPIVHVLDVRDPTAPRVVGTVDVGGAAEDVVLRGTWAWVRVLRAPRINRYGNYLPFPRADVVAIDLGEPTRPLARTVALLPADRWATDIALSRDTLLVATVQDDSAVSQDYHPMLVILTIAEPEAPRLIGLREGPAWVRLSTGPWRPAGTVSGSGDAEAQRVYGVGFQYEAIDLTDPGEPEHVEGTTGLELGPGHLVDIEMVVAGGLNVVWNSSWGGISIGRPMVPSDMWLGSTRLPGRFAGGVAALGDSIMVAGRSGRFSVLEPLGTEEPQSFGHVASVAQVAATRWDGVERIITMSYNGGLGVLDHEPGVGPIERHYVPISANGVLGLDADGARGAVSLNQSSSIQRYDYRALDFSRSPPGFGARFVVNQPASRVLDVRGTSLLGADLWNDAARRDNHKLVLVDIEDIDRPEPHTEVPIPGTLVAAARDDDLVVALHAAEAPRHTAVRALWLTRIDVSDERAPRVVDSQLIANGDYGSVRLSNVTPSDHRAMMTLSVHNDDGQLVHRLLVADVGLGAPVRLRGQLDLPHEANAVSMHSGIAALALHCRARGPCMSILVDATNPNQPRLLGQLATLSGEVQDSVAFAEDGTVYLADGDAGLLAYHHLTDPTPMPERSPTPVPVLPWPSATPSPLPPPATATSPAPTADPLNTIWLPLARLQPHR